MAAIKTRERGGGELAAVTTQAPASGGAGCRWLLVAANRAGLASGNRWSPPDPAPGWGRLPRIATRTLGMGSGSVRVARDFTVATLHRWGAAERSDDIATVMSELLANALRHALPAPGDMRPRRPIRLGLLQPGPCVLCAVADPGPAVPVPQAPGFLAETGRGLHIICALSDTWGYAPLGDTGKVVWATFTSPLTPPLPGPVAGPGRQLVPAAAKSSPCKREPGLANAARQHRPSGIRCRDWKGASRGGRCQHRRSGSQYRKDSRLFPAAGQMERRRASTPAGTATNTGAGAQPSHRSPLGGSAPLLRCRCPLSVPSPRPPRHAPDAGL